MSVLLEDPSDLALHLATVAAVLAEVLDEPQADALQRARYSAGVLARDLPVPVARRIQLALEALKVRSFLVPEADMQAAPRARRLGRLELREEGLALLGFMKAGEPKLVPWDDVLAISAWALAQQNPSDDLREALPRRGGTLAKLSPDTRRVLDELRTHEERERAVVQLGLDLLLSGPRLYRIRCEDPGIYGPLEPELTEEAIQVGFADLAGFVLGNPDGPDWSGFEGSTVEWEGVIDEVLEGVLIVRPRRGADQGVRLVLRDPADLQIRDLVPGVTVAYRGRLGACLRDEGVFEVLDGQFQLASHSVGNYLALVRKLVRVADGLAHVPKPTQRFAERADFTDILFAKPEERDGLHAWIMQALDQGVLGEVEDIDDAELTDSDVALVVGDGASDFDDVEDLDDDELEEDIEDVDDDELIDEGSGETLDLDGVEVPEEDDAPPPRPLSTRLGSLTDIGELDAELSAAMDHIAGKSARLSREHIQEMIAAAESMESLHGSLLESLEGELGELDDELREAMSFFDVAKSGKWKLADILGADAEIDEDEAQA